MILHRQKLLVRAIRFGILIAIFGSSLFVAIEEIRLGLMLGWDGDLEFTVLVFIVGSILASVIAVLGSCLLALVLYDRASKDELTLSKSIFFGRIAGFVSGIGVSILGVVLTNGRGSLSLYLLHTVEVAAIAVLCGGWMGSNLARYIQVKDS